MKNFRFSSFGTHWIITLLVSIASFSIFNVYAETILERVKHTGEICIG